MSQSVMLECLLGPIIHQSVSALGKIIIIIVFVFIIIDRFCHIYIHHTIMYQFTVTPQLFRLKATQVGCMRVTLYPSCHLHFWQNDRDVLRATAVTTGMDWIPKSVNYSFISQ